MKILCTYIMSGNGHLVPARTVKIELEKLGHEVQLIPVFDILNLRWFATINRFIWREMLKHLTIEKRLVSGAD